MNDKLITSGYLLDCVMSYFSDIELSENFASKAYSISRCTSETIISIDKKSKYYIEIFFNYNNISNIRIVRRFFFQDKYYYPLLSLEKKAKYEILNNFDSLEERFKLLAQVTKEYWDELKNNT